MELFAFFISCIGFFILWLVSKANKNNMLSTKQYRFYVVFAWVFILAGLSLLNYICELKNGY